MAGPVKLHVPENLPSAFEETDKKTNGILDYLDNLKKELKKYSDAIALRLFSTSGGAGVDEHVAFWTTDGILTGDDNFVWDNSNKFLGLGTVDPKVRLHIERTISGDHSGVSTAGYGYAFGELVETESVATASGSGAGQSRAALQVVHKEQPGSTGTAFGILSVVEMNRTSAPVYSEHFGVMGAVYQHSPASAQSTMFGVDGYVERHNSGATYGLYSETNNYVAASGLYPIGLEISSGLIGAALRAGTAVHIRSGPAGWTEAIRFTDTDETTIRFQLRNDGCIVIRQPASPVEATIHLICPDATNGPSMEFEGQTGSTFFNGFSGGSGFNFINSGITRAMAQFFDSPSSGACAMTLLVNQAGVLILKPVLLGPNGSGPGGTNRMLYVNN